MKRKKQPTNAPPEDSVVRELVRIRNLLMLELLVCHGLASEDVDLAVQMGSAEIRRALPVGELKRSRKKSAGNA